jgi:hypothetical protein
MAFTIEVDADAMLKQLDSLTENVKNLETETSVTFFNWQAEDMHRHYPKIEGSGLSVSTVIYPRSRLRKVKNLAGGKSTRRRARVAAGRSSSHRPILRPELFDQLKTRMIEMVKEAFKWR